MLKKSDQNELLDESLVSEETNAVSGEETDAIDAEETSEVQEKGKKEYSYLLPLPPCHPYHRLIHPNSDQLTADKVSCLAPKYLEKCHLEIQSRYTCLRVAVVLREGIAKHS